jgi:hypothetical protein
MIAFVCDLQRKDGRSEACLTRLLIACYAMAFTDRTVSSQVAEHFLVIVGFCAAWAARKGACDVAIKECRWFAVGDHAA